VGAVVLFAMLAAAPTAAEGQKAFQRCYACHSVDPREQGLQGPKLAGVVGRRAATQRGFEYSPAMRQAGARGLVWTEAALDRFMIDPSAVVPKTSMFIPPMRDRRERQAVIVYLKSRKAPK